jgi:hypothetical protein
VSQQELLKTVIQALDRAEIPYMITGSIVSSLQGEPRATHDIDIIVSIRKTRARVFVKAFPSPDFYVEEESILDAIDRRHMFSLLDVKEGGKVDFWILTDEPFDRSRFARRYPEEFMGLKMQVSRPEDTILVKLRWANLSGGSEKQFTDALRVYEVQYEKLDLDYLESWAKKLDIELLWNRLKDGAQVP